jgi:hypothetical protein
MATRASCKQYAWLLGGVLTLAVVLGILAPAAQASPFVTVWMEARINLSGNAYSTAPLAVVAGQKIDYRIMAALLPAGATNSMAAAGGLTVNNLAESGSFVYPPAPDPPMGWLIANGINGMKFNLYQISTDPVQASFTLTGAVWGPVSVNPDLTYDGSGDTTWGAGPGFSKGLAQARPGGVTTIKNLNGVRPILPVGFYAGVDSAGHPIPMMVISGTTSPMSGTTGGVTVSKNDSLIRVSAITPVDASVSTTMRVNGRLDVDGVTPLYDSVSEYTVWASDPVTVYNGVTLYTPWAEATINVPAGGFTADITKTDPLHLVADAGGSSHTTVNYHWVIASGEPLVYDTTNPMLDVSIDDLKTLGEGIHTITLSVMTGDGKSAIGTPQTLTLTPEPATMALLSLGGLVAFLRRRVR